MKFIQALSDNLKIIIIGLISILMIAVTAILLIIFFGGDRARVIVVTEIKGEISAMRDGHKINISKGTRLGSGDIISTGKDSSLRLRLDPDKYAWIEPETSCYIHYTGVELKGDIAVNITGGAVICQINENLSDKMTFRVKTPNSAINVRGTVFRTEFDYLETFLDYTDVMITNVQNFSGAVNIQLYDVNAEKVELPMLLTERTEARLMTSENVSQYLFLNHETDIYKLRDGTISDIIKISGEKKTAYSIEELSHAFRAASDERRRIEESVSETAPPEETAVTERTTAAPIETAPPLPDWEPEISEPPAATTADTLPTVMSQIGEYTVYSGPRWWEAAGGPSYQYGDGDVSFYPDDSFEPEFFYPEE